MTRTVPLLAVAALGPLLGACGERTPPAPRPNVIVLLVDTVRSDRVGAWGYDAGSTPNIDALAAESFVFRRTVAPSSWTKPSVASLFTGLYPGRHGAVGSRTNRPALAALDPALTTLAERMKAGGYATAAFVQNPHVDAIDHFDQGFDLFHQPAGDVTGILAGGLRWIEERTGDAPFFLYLHVLEPHAPYTPPPAYRERFAPESPGPESPFTAIGNPMEVVVWSRAFRNWKPAEAGERFDLDESTLRPDLLDPGILAELQRLDPTITRENLVSRLHLDFAGPEDPELLRRKDHLEALYDGEIAAVDAVIGRFLGELRAKGILDASVVVLLSDHGEAFLEHGLWGHGNGVHAEELCVPLLVRVPSEAGPLRGELRTPVSLVDLQPTLLDLVGLPVPEDVDGRSLWPAMRGEADAGLTERAVFAEAFAHSGEQAAVIVGATQLVRAVHPDGTVEWTTYDDAFGPAAPADGWAEEDLRRTLEAFLERRTISFDRTEPVPETPAETHRRLKALGY